MRTNAENERRETGRIKERKEDDKRDILNERLGLLENDSDESAVSYWLKTKNYVFVTYDL